MPTVSINLSETAYDHFRSIMKYKRSFYVSNAILAYEEVMRQERMILEGVEEE